MYPKRREGIELEPIFHIDFEGATDNSIKSIKRYKK